MSVSIVGGVQAGHLNLNPKNHASKGIGPTSESKSMKLVASKLKSKPRLKTAIALKAEE